MMKVSLRIVETVINLAIGTLLVVLVVLAMRYYVGNRPLTSKLNLEAGTRINLSGVSWREHKQTLLLALSKDCHFCSESAPFYRRLMAEVAATGNARAIAVLPNAPSDARTYLESVGVNAREVKQADLGSIGVWGTPTLILVDGEGRVRRAWIGELGSRGQEEVLAAIRTKVHPNGRR